MRRATFSSALLAVLCSPLVAGVYDGWVASPDGHYAIRNLSGKMVIAASTATYSTATITLDGTTGNITAGKYYGDGSSLSGISASASLVGVRYSTDPVSTSLIDLSTVTAAIANASPNLTGVRYSTDPVSVGLIDLSTVTASLSDKLSNTATIPAGLVDLSTVTTALSAKADVASVVPSSATGYYGLYVASAAYAANGFTPGASILNNGSYGLVTSSDVVAHAYYGDGSHLTGVSTSGGSISTAAYDGAPIGTFINYGSTIPPAGYLYCDGTNYSTTTYRDLFSVIGYNYSGFAISSGPVFTCDFRGMFSRGLDTAKLRDSEYRVIGSTEADKMQGHSHEFWALQDAASSSGSGTAAARGGANATQRMIDNSYVKNTISDGTNGTPRTGLETRPENVAVAVMVKYGNPMVVNVSAFALINTTNTFTGANTFTGGISATQSIVTSSDVVAHAYYGDGSKLTGLAGGGDMVLSATQTVTAAKTFTSISNYPIWLKFSKSYSDFSTATLTNSINLFTLPAGGIIHAVKIKHSTAFAGTSITAYNVSVGITGALAKYASTFNVFQAVAGDTFQLSSGLFSESHTTATDVKVTATSIGANLSAATQGSIDIWVLTSTAI